MVSDKKREILFAALSGILLVLIFPRFNLSFLSWVCLVPLLLATCGKPAGRSFLLGFIAGFVSFSGILYWVVPTMIADGESMLFSLAMLLVFSSLLSIFYGIFCALLALTGSGKSRGAVMGPLVAAALWVLTEWLRGHIFTGFPWALLGYSQWKNVLNIQLSEYTAVYGVSFLIVAVNVIFRDLLRGVLAGKGGAARRLAAVLLIFLLNGLFGAWRVASIKNDGGNGSVRAGVLQGNISQYMKWDQEYRDRIMDNYSYLVREAAREKPQVLIWPETALPAYLRYDKKLYETVKGLCLESRCYHIIGSPELEDKKYYNSAFLVSPDGALLSRYDKVHLVPIGEYMPGKKYFSRIFPVLNGLGDFTAGTEIKGLNMPCGNAGALVCYEIIFPEPARALVNSGAEFLVNITNDAWYLETAALEQHFSMAVFRAVENRISVARAANTGISGFINRYGGVDRLTKMSEKTFLVSGMKLRGKKSFYTRFGDVFVLALLIFVFVAFLTGGKKVAAG